MLIDFNRLRTLLCYIPLKTESSFYKHVNVTPLNGAADNEIGDDLIKHLHWGKACVSVTHYTSKTYNPISERAPFVKKQEPIKWFSHFTFLVFEEVSLS